MEAVRDREEFFADTICVDQVDCSQAYVFDFDDRNSRFTKCLTFKSVTGNHVCDIAQRLTLPCVFIESLH